MNTNTKLTAFIDKYLVPIYKRDGIASVIILVSVLVGFALLAFYLGLTDIIMEMIDG